MLKKRMGLTRNLYNQSFLGPDEIKEYVDNGYMSALNVPFVYGTHDGK